MCLVEIGTPVINPIPASPARRTRSALIRFQPKPVTACTTLCPGYGG